MGRYIDLRTDFGFKRLFGQEDSKGILKRFLYDVLRLPHPIQELVYISPEQLPTSPDDRVGIYDVYCVDTSGRRFIVEMQKNWQTYFKERTLYYCVFPILHQARKGKEWQFELLPIYCIAVQDFNMDDDERYLRRVQLADVDTGDIFYDKLTFVYVELPKFRRSAAELTDEADKWIYLLKNMPELQDIPAELADQPFTQAFHIAEEAALSTRERMLYEASLKRAPDELASLQGALQKGQEQGRSEAMREIGRSMLARGLDLALVLELTGLTEDELR